MTLCLPIDLLYIKYQRPVLIYGYKPGIYNLITKFNMHLTDHRAVFLHSFIFGTCRPTYNICTWMSVLLYTYITGMYYFLSLHTSLTYIRALGCLFCTCLSDTYLLTTLTYTVCTPVSFPHFCWLKHNIIVRFNFTAINVRKRRTIYNSVL